MWICNGPVIKAKIWTRKTLQAAVNHEVSFILVRCTHFKWNWILEVLFACNIFAAKGKLIE